jgi:phosphoribosyl 1,2-cyclic phosphodiesterase/CheY-like chemotaxis protein
MQKVAIIEDDPDICRIVETRLRAAGYEVLTATDGQKGLELIRAERPCLVLVDLMLPKMHGFAVCQEVRRDPRLRGVQVIVATAKAYPVDAQKAKELGAIGYLTKPYDLEELLEMVQKILHMAGPQIMVKFWGTRGSIPTPGPSTLRYGGNTSCVEVRCADKIMMLDCGTGAREMGLELTREFQGRALDIHIFISHTHWDHIQGFPFFAPAYVAGNRLTIYSLRESDKSLEKVFGGQMDSSYFPVPLSDLVARLRFVELEGPVELGPAKISHVYLNHPGMAIGFRIDVGPKSVVYITDHEPFWRTSGDNEQNRKLDQSVDEFARAADLYIREAQYTDEEYPSKRGWGHSTWTDALESAHHAGVKTLALYHHEPTHDDRTIDRIVAACHEHMQKRGMQFQCLASTSTLEITL